VRELLERHDEYPMRDYLTVTDQDARDFTFLPWWPTTTKGRINGGERDDDIDYPILGMHMLETLGAGIGPSQVADAWLRNLPYLRVFTAERATYMNLLNGVDPEQAGEVRNPYREWIGALIRADIFGWTNPGRDFEAARAAYRDATLSHRANGVYGEMWAAALVAAAFNAADVFEVIERANAVLPPHSRLAEAVAHVRALHDSGISFEEALEQFDAAYGHYEWVHTIPNAAVIMAGLLWSGGDFSVAVGNTIMGGRDTDSNAATVGSIMGILLGADALPAHWVEPLQDRTRSAVFGFAEMRISELADRTLALVR